MQAKNFPAILQDSLNSRLADLEILDPALIVYPESGWRVQDVLAHVAGWNHEVANALVAHLAGVEYYIPNYDQESFNQALYKSCKDQTPEQVSEAWRISRARLQEAAEKLTDAQLTAQIFYPSGERGRADALLDEVLEHEAEHFAHMLSAG